MLDGRWRPISFKTLSHPIALGRNALIGLGYANLDLSMFKSFPMPYAESHKVEFRAEFFNSLNRVNLGNPNATLNSANAGRILGSDAGRQVPFALKYLF